MKRFSKNNCPNTHELTEKGNCVKKCGNSRERNTSTQRCKKQCLKSTHELTGNGNCVKKCVDGKTRNQSSKRKRCKRINANTRKRQSPRKKKSSSLYSYQPESHEYQPNSGQQSSSASKDNSQYSYKSGQTASVSSIHEGDYSPSVSGPTSGPASVSSIHEGDYSPSVSGPTSGPASAGPQHMEDEVGQKTKYRERTREQMRERFKTVHDKYSPYKRDHLTSLSSAETVASFITPEDSGEYIPKTNFTSQYTPQPTSLQKQQQPPNKSIKDSLKRNLYSTNPKHNEIRHAKGTKFTTLNNIMRDADKHKRRMTNTKTIKATTKNAQNAHLERLAKPTHTVKKQIETKATTKNAQNAHLEMLAKPTHPVNKKQIETKATTKNAQNAHLKMLAKPTHKLAKPTHTVKKQIETKATTKNAQNAHLEMLAKPTHRVNKKQIETKKAQIFR
jgi:hypothetical protein